MTKNPNTTNPTSVNRRKVIAGLAVAPLAGVAASLPAQAMTPLERIRYHLSALEAAFRDYYPDSTVKATFNEVTPEHRECGCVGCVMVHTYTGFDEICVMRRL